MFGKHYESMYTGSMMGAGSEVFAIWGYVISHQRPNRDGTYTVELNPKLLAVVIGEELPIVEAVLKKFQEPDLASRSKEEEGRRLVKLGEYLYRVVNGAYYRELADDEARRSYNRIKQREHRAKKAEGNDGSSSGNQESDACAIVPEALKGSAEFMGAWAHWLEHLKQKRKSPSVHSQELQLKKLAASGVTKAIETINHSIEHNWQGLYEDNGEAKRGKPASEKTDREKWEDREMAELERERKKSEREFKVVKEKLAAHDAVDKVKSHGNQSSDGDDDEPF